jgi:hypothetical protein
MIHDKVHLLVLCMMNEFKMHEVNNVKMATEIIIRTRETVASLISVKWVRCIVHEGHCLEISIVCQFPMLSSTCSMHSQPSIETQIP